MSLHQEIARTFYETARNEIITRIQMRETAIFVWLGAVGVVGGMALGGDHPTREVLLVLPLLAVGFAMRISDHERVIGQLAVYATQELGPHLLAAPDFLQWDASHTLHDRSFQGRLVRVRGDIYYIFIVAPAILALAMNGPFLRQSGRLGWAIVALDGTCIVLTIALIASASSPWQKSFWRKRTTDSKGLTSAESTLRALLPRAARRSRIKSSNRSAPPARPLSPEQPLQAPASPAAADHLSPPGDLRGAG